MARRRPRQATTCGSAASVSRLVVVVAATLTLMCALPPASPLHAPWTTTAMTTRGAWAADHTTSHVTATAHVVDTTSSSNSGSRSDDDDDEHTHALLAAGDYAMGLGRAHYDDALANYTAALVRNERSVRGLYSRALLLSLLRRRADARADLEALLRLAPQHTDALALHLDLCAQSGLLDRAARDAATLAELYTRSAQPTRARELRATQRTLEQYARQWHELADLLDDEDKDAVLAHELISSDDDGDGVRSSNDDAQTRDGRGTHTSPTRRATPRRDAPGAGAARPRRTRARYAQCVSLLTHVLRDFAKDNVQLRLRRALCALALGDYAAASHDVHAILHSSSSSGGGSVNNNNNNNNNYNNKGSPHANAAGGRAGGGATSTRRSDSDSGSSSSRGDDGAHYLIAVALNARVLRGLGALAQAQHELRRCLSLDPEFAPCARLLRRVRVQERTVAAVPEQLRTRQYAAALRTMAQATHDEPHPPYEDDLLQWRCAAYAGLHDVTRGLPACEAALRRLGTDNPVAVSVYLHKAELHLHTSSADTSGRDSNNNNKKRRSVNDDDNDDIDDEDIDAAARELSHAQRLAPHDERVRELQRRLDALRRRSEHQGKNYYKILGVRKSASAHDIRRAYRKLAKQYHPDQLRSKNMTSKERERQEALFRDINEAKEVLLDADKRARYDKGEDVTKPTAGQGANAQTFYGQPFTFPFDGFAGGARAFPRGFPFHQPRGGHGRAQQQQEQHFFFFQQG